MIYIDASRYNNTNKRTGVENYSYFLINELIKQEPGEITLIAPKEIPLKVKQITIPFPRLWTQIRLSWEVLRNKKITNLFVPSHVLPLIHPKNSTITIHDAAWNHVPESYGFLSKLYLEWGTKYAVKHAKNIITPSETTKKDLIDFYKADPQNIHVIPLGFQKSEIKESEDEESETLRNYQLSAISYLLFIGRIEHKKNTDTLIKAFSKVAEKNPDTKLVLAGSLGRGGQEILDSIPSDVRDRIIVTGYVSDEEKHVLLKNALCFVFPSRYEGFGIPLLEAMSYNLPIIASSIPTSLEIAKNNALFFNVSDAEKLEGLINQVITKKDLITDHSDTLKKYSWEKAAKQTLATII